jgi:hypothetical protein
MINTGNDIILYYAVLFSKCLILGIEMKNKYNDDQDVIQIQYTTDDKTEKTFGKLIAYENRSPDLFEFKFNFTTPKKHLLFVVKCIDKFNGICKWTLCYKNKYYYNLHDYYLDCSINTMIINPNVIILPKHKNYAIMLTKHEGDICKCMTLYPDVNKFTYVNTDEESGISKWVIIFNNNINTKKLPTRAFKCSKIAEFIDGYCNKICPTPIDSGYIPVAGSTFTVAVPADACKIYKMIISSSYTNNENMDFVDLYKITYCICNDTINEITRKQFKCSITLIDNVIMNVDTVSNQLLVTLQFNKTLDNTRIKTAYKNIIISA